MITLDVTRRPPQTSLVIRSFKDREAETIFAGRRSRRLPADIQSAALRKLLLLEAASNLSELRTPPGNHLEALSGDRDGQHSIRINDQWRVCFRWAEGGASDVEVVDYHS